MSCIIKYKGQSIPEEQFLQYLNKQIAINNLFNENKTLANSIYEALGFGKERSLPTSSKTINIYAGSNENAELSNFAIRPFTTTVETLSGERQYTFQSVEQGFHFYKALIANNSQVAKQILATTNGGQLKRLTNKSNLKMTPEQVKEWDDTSKSIMLNLMYDSYVQNPEAAKKLLATGNAKITHTQDNTRWKTDFPEVVMTVRDMLREEGFNTQSQITPEQKQQAQQLYSRYLDTIGVTNIGYHHSESDLEGFKEFVKDSNNIIPTSEKIISLTTPELYYSFKSKKPENVKKVLNKPRDLKPTLHTFSVEGRTMNTFDLLPVRLKFRLKNRTLTEEDKLILNAFISKFKINANDDRLIDKYLTRWLQRTFEVLDHGKLIDQLESTSIFYNRNEKGNITGIDLDKYFNNDTLFNSLIDVKDHYLNDDNSKFISNYNFQEAELIMGDIYKSKFKRDSNDSMYEIDLKGYEYFSEKIAKDFEKDNTEADFKLNIKGMNNPIYIKYVDKMPGNNQNIRIISEYTQNEGKIERKYVRKNDFDETLYTIPDLTTTQVAIIDNKEFILVLNSSKYLNNNLDRLLNSFKDNIKSFIPLLNNSSLDEVNNITFDKFIKYSGFPFSKYDKLDNTWYIRNTKIISEEFGKKMFASWKKSHSFIAARIPAQSMQSFMPMRNVAYHNTLTNDAYVSVYQILLQGSDFDIDKAYMLGNGFNSRGYFEDWVNPISIKYSSIDQLNAISKLPIPSGSEVKLKSQNKTSLNVIDLTEDFKNFVANRSKLRSHELTVRQINILNSVLRKTKNSNLIQINIDNIDGFTPLYFEQLINDHNLNNNYSRKRNAIKNSIVDKINSIISMPSNQIFANSPVEVKSWHSAVEANIETRKQNGEVFELENLSLYNPFSIYKQQWDASVGKSDVGIFANGIKVLSALSSYYNNYYANEFENTPETLRRSFKTFKKEFVFNNTTFKPTTISDVNISSNQLNLLKDAIGDGNNYKEWASLILSGLTSAATDNAKELLLAKVNASAELASMLVYLSVLGFNKEQIVEIMTSKVVRDIVDGLNSNIFFDEDTPKVYAILSDLKNLPIYEEDRKEDLENITELYYSAQEFKVLASILGVNQKTSANTEELTKFLTKFETAMYSRENLVFGSNLEDIEYWVVNKDSINDSNREKAETIIKNLIAKIFNNSKWLNSGLDENYVKDILLKASKINVEYTNEFGEVSHKTESLLGGKFNYRYYVNNNNEEYRKITKEYYNLIKGTINIFDVVDSVPHFKYMIEGLVLSYNILNNQSKMFNFVQNEFRAITRRNTSRIVFSDKEINSNIKNQMANKALPVAIDSKAVSKIKLGVYTKIKSKWLKSESTSHLTFSARDMIKLANSKLNSEHKIKDFIIYTSDDARLLSEITDKSKYIKKVNENDVEDTIISLDTDYGIANFKRMMEMILLPIIQNSSDGVSDLYVKSVWNLFGLRGEAIISKFQLSSITDPVSLDLAQNLLYKFNNLDVNFSNKNIIKNISGETIKWRDLFYLYNLLVNNDMYGDLRLTPLFQDYMKEPNTLGNDYVRFTAKFDSGEVKLFDYDFNITEGDSEDEKDNKRKINMISSDNDILFYAFNDSGKLSVKTKDLKVKVLSVVNPDFVVITGISESEEEKIKDKELSDLFKIIRKRGFIIKFEC